MVLVKTLRERAGITQATLADAMNVTQSCISMWETGEATPQSDKLPKLAEVLGCRIDDLFEKKENPA